MKGRGEIWQVKVGNSGGGGGVGKKGEGETGLLEVTKQNQRTLGCKPPERNSLEFISRFTN